MLSNTRAEQRDDLKRRQNLYCGLAKTMLSLASLPQPRIGAFQFHADGTITVSNRPLTTSIAILENDGAPCCIPRDRTYAAAESYVSDLVTFHDHRLSSNRNAAFDATDCRSMMASKVTFRAVAHRYILEDRQERKATPTREPVLTNVMKRTWEHGDSDEFVEGKVRDYETYCEELKKLYADNDAPAGKQAPLFCTLA
ncbi:uncharacterized protein J7T54_007231 [Emericellopsis cladophorae]|uniref:Uncharacterized protein n=1 Tax=Emericellopsis cladophorae TaxID=2686198 RepID=A0A9Q0BCI6_9HYPO|nr:uncharacterized protein J7T54_007231 [Emericellopsis cladophorae]KAI6780382.1 hypothetical protein J7T54_007231 [Emericellopsis cladophorae]